MIMSLTQATPPFPYIGEIAAVAAAIFWSIALGLFTKHGKGFPAKAMNQYKNVTAMIYLMIAFIFMRPDIPSDPMTWIMLTISGIIGLSIGDTALFAALPKLGAQTTSASQCLAPPLASIIAIILTGETLTYYETTGMIVTMSGIAGVIFATNQKKTPQSPPLKSLIVSGFLFAFISALSQASAVVIMRHHLQQTNILVGTMIRLAPAILVLYLVDLFRGRKTGFMQIIGKPKKAFLLAIASFLGTFMGLILLSTSVKYAKAGIAAALTSTSPIWVIPIAKFFLKERVSWQSTVCTILAVIGVIVMVSFR
jgi:drug/metabolite transporter (DMT)-like permease